MRFFFSSASKCLYAGEQGIFMPFVVLLMHFPAMAKCQLTWASPATVDSYLLSLSFPLFFLLILYLNTSRARLKDIFRFHEFRRSFHQFPLMFAAVGFVKKKESFVFFLFKLFFYKWSLYFGVEDLKELLGLKFFS